MADSTDRQTYFKTMSQAFAILSSGDALVMARDPQDVPTEGIFYTVEFPQLMSDSNTFGRVDLVRLMTHY